jgi:hypothetical protein
MRLNFPTLILAPVVMAAAALTIQPALAETTTLKVPFEFSVGNKILPAGPYTVERDSHGSFLRLQGPDASQTFTWLARPSATRTGRVVLRFEEEGKTHKLQSVQYGVMQTPDLEKRIKGSKAVLEEISAQ